MKTITRDDVRALLMAESVHFHTYQGRSWIVAELHRSYSREAPRIYSKTEQALFPGVGEYARERFREIDADHARLSDYSSRTGGYSAFCSPYRMEILRTIFRALREGDALTFEWIASNNSEKLDAAGWVRDEFILHAGQPPADGKKRRPASAWLIESQVGPDNSARMVRR